MTALRLLTRPSLWTMVYAGMIAWSAYALWAMPMEVLPRFAYPQVGIVAHWPGASPNEMEALVLRPLEGELLGLSDLASLHALGQTLNLLTLGALTVAVGLLADDGIIVLEAIFHRWEQGQLGSDGVWLGLKDIAAPDNSGTLTTVSTYLPLVAVTGLAGLFFVPFALAMSLALIGSLVVSLTPIPLLAARLRSSRQPAQTRGGRLLATLGRLNSRLLDITIAHPRVSLAISALLLAASAGALALAPTHFLPLPNEGVLLDSFTLPPGTSLDQTRATMIDLDMLRKLSAQAVARLRTVPALTDLFNNDAYPVTQLRISPKPEAMRAFAITPAALSRQLRPTLRGDVIAQMPDGDYRLALFLRLTHAERLSTEALGGILIKTGQGWTPLGMLADAHSLPPHRADHAHRGARHAAHCIGLGDRCRARARARPGHRGRRPVELHPVHQPAADALSALAAARLNRRSR
nr:efflux RND transporter permease subunit [Thiohalocapsa sp.]